MGFEYFFVEPRFVVVAVGIGEGRELDEVAVPNFIFCEQHLVIPGAIRFVAHATGGDVELTPDDGLDAGLFCRGKKLRDAKQISVIRYCKCLLFEFSGFGDELLDTRGPVEE